MFRPPVLAILAAACAGGALAQSYPTKPVRLMLGYTAGSTWGGWMNSKPLSGDEIVAISRNR